MHLQKLDDYDLRTLNVSHLREHVSLVSQEPVLFDRTIRENIAYGLKEVPSDDSIENAAKIANIHDFLINLPQVWMGLLSLPILLRYSMGEIFQFHLCIIAKWRYQNVRF